MKVELIRTIAQIVDARGAMMRATPAQRQEYARLAIEQLVEAQRTRQHYDDLLQAAIKELGDTDPGPLISGIYSEKFPEHIKDELRTLAHNIGVQVENSLHLWQMAGKRRYTWLRIKDNYRRLKDGRVSYY